jgi:hypothetical protein
MSTSPAFATATLVLLAAFAARAEAPLSAIDWLSQSVNIPAAGPAPEIDEPAISEDAGTEDISVSVLGGPSPDAAGLLAPSLTGLPHALWGLGLTDEIVTQITAPRPEMLPSLQALFITLLLAEAEPPADAEGKGSMLLARVDKLLDLGALDQAAALLQVAGSTDPELFRRTFDVALLTGTEDSACVQMRSNPQLAPTFPARIFCLARSGDWNAAALTLRTAQALGYVTDAEDALLSRFLDPELYEGELALASPDRPSPLVWRMMEAVGEPLPTNALPLAFAHAELRDTAGWKAQVEAAERLARAGAIAPNRLLGLYTERQAAASGGVWERVKGVQALENAINSGNAAEIAVVLPVVWATMVDAELEVPFATIFAVRLSRIPVDPATSSLVFRIGLLASTYETTAKNRVPADTTEAFLIGIARGQLGDTPAPDSLGRTIAPAFIKPAPSPEAMGLIADRRIGEAIMTAIDQIDNGLRGNPEDVTEGLSLLRVLGLEDAARRTALELMLLERRG